MEAKLTKTFKTATEAWVWQRANPDSVLAKSPLYSTAAGWTLRHDTTALPPASAVDAGTL